MADDNNDDRNIDLDELSQIDHIQKSLKIEEEDDDNHQNDEQNIGILSRENLISNLARSNSVPARSWTIKLQVSTSSATDGKLSEKEISSPVESILNDENHPSPEEEQQQKPSDENYQYISVEHADMSFPVFRELWEQKQVCDVIVRVGNRDFSAHRVLLCATMPYFYAMFTHDLVERNQNVVEIKTSEHDDTPTLDPEAFESLLRYAYTGSIAINTENVQSLLIGASFLGLINVQQACSDYLKIRLNVCNVLNVKSFALALGCETLVQASERFIHRHFEEIAHTGDFSNLSFDELIEVIGSDQLNISNEKIVFEAIIRWTKRDEEMRQHHLPALMAQIRLPLLYPEYLTDVVMAEKLVRQSLPCRDLVDEAKDFHLLPQRREMIPRCRIRPRLGHHIQGSIYAVGGLTKSGDSMSTVEVYDPQTKRWRMAEAMTMMRSRVGVAVMDGKLYAIGGYNGVDRLNTVEVYDSKLKQWKRVKSMHYRRSAVGAAALNGYLYVCGGYNGSVSLNVVERYLATTNEWSVTTPMNIKRSATGVVALDGYIYALGGHDGLMIFNSVERYDPQTDQWEFVEPMLSRRCRLGVTAFGGKIYVCGGYDGCTFLQTAEMYDPRTRQWRPIAKMRVTRSRVALVANCAKLFAIGGYDGVTNLSSVETYDIENDCWEMVSPMVAHEGGVGVGVIPDNY